MDYISGLIIGGIVGGFVGCLMGIYVGASAIYAGARVLGAIRHLFSH